MSVPKYARVAAIVRDQITDGTLAPGAPVPSGAALSRLTGYSVTACRHALRSLIADGALIPGASRHARPRVPGTNRNDQAPAEAKRALSMALAGHRRAAGLTQPQLAELIGLSVTSIGHAETGRTWQSRPFWELADKVLNTDGELLRLHDAYRAAETMPETSPPPTVVVNVPEPVTCITITWADGAVTTVHPPAGHEPATAESDRSEQ
jgi:DNA-binding XRE family transcriptional regulator